VILSDLLMTDVMGAPWEMVDAGGFATVETGAIG
jgi:hypothetical protein